MKKALSVILIVLMVFSFAAAEEFDLSKLDYEELKILMSKCQMEIMSRPEWKEVRVFIGRWRIGEDIPAGQYSFFYSGDYMCTIELWGQEQDNYTAGGGYIYGEVLTPEENTIGKLLLNNGNLLIIEDSSVIVRPAISLGF